jgi:HTH-type transcriptional regulator/antitoxin HipB
MDDRLAETMRSKGSGSTGGASTGRDAARALGEAVRARRRALGLDQLVLCDLAGVGPAFLYSLEHGKPTVRIDKVLAVMTVLGLELHVRPGREGVSVDPRVQDATR